MVGSRSEKGRYNPEVSMRLKVEEEEASEGGVGGGPPARAREGHCSIASPGTYTTSPDRSLRGSHLDLEGTGMRP